MGDMVEDDQGRFWMVDTSASNRSGVRAEGHHADQRPGRTAFDNRRTFTKPPNSQNFQRGVGGGDLETVPHFTSVDVDFVTHKCIAFCDEDGIAKELPHNGLAMALWRKAAQREDFQSPPQDFLLGPVVILYGDDDFMESL